MHIALRTVNLYMLSDKDIIRMAREAGFICLLPGEGAVPEQAGIWSDDANVLTQFERFAALVAAAEREACAALCDTMSTDETKWCSPTDCANEIRKLT
jgi:hypothetical protein